MKQLDDLQVVKPQESSTMTKEQKKNSLPCLMFLTEKRDETIKTRMCVDGSTQEMDKDEIAAPTISTDALFITLIIDAEEERDIATINVQGAFLQTAAKPGNYIKFTGSMVGILCQLNQKLYNEFVTL